MDAEKAFSLVSQYGIATFLCLITMGFLFYVLKWVFKTSSEREMALAQIINVGLANLSTNMSHLSESIQSNTAMVQEITRNMKDGFDAMRRADEYQREEHRKMLTQLDDAECKAK